MPFRRSVTLSEGGKSSSGSKRAIEVVTHRSFPGMGGSSSNGTSAAGSGPAPKSSPRAIMAREKVAVSAWRQSEPPEQMGWTEPAGANGLMWTESCSAKEEASQKTRCLIAYPHATRDGLVPLRLRPVTRALSWRALLYPGRYLRGIKNPTYRILASARPAAPGDGLQRTWHLNFGGR